MAVSIRIQKCEGYVWESDKTEPQVYRGTPCELMRLDTDNPFILEALLYDVESQISYMVKFIDGEHRVYKYNLFESYDDASDVEYLPNRMNGVGKLKFKQIWKKQKDELCNDFETLVPAELVFVGFADDKENA